MLQEDINTLQQENMGMQTAIAIALEQKKAVLEQTPPARLLSATAAATTALLTIDNFDAAVNTALQIMGESLDCDRVTVIENFQFPSNPTVAHWRLLYEWTSCDTVSQISDPDVAQGTWEGIEAWYERCRQGDSISYLLEEMPEPFRSGQAAIGVKALYGVPIFVENQYWGVVGFDDCRAAKRRNLAELDVLKTAATCIGSAIQRKRREQALLQAEQARVAELARVNAQLTQLNQELLERKTQQEVLFSISQAIAKVQNHKQLLKVIYEQIKPVFPYDNAGLFVLDQTGEHIYEILDDQVLPDAIQTQLTQAGLLGFFPFLGHKPQAWIYAESPVICSLPEQAEYFLKSCRGQFEIGINAGLQQMIGGSLYCGGKKIGMLSFNSQQRNFYSEQHISLFKGISDLVAIAVANILANEGIVQRETQLLAAQQALLQAEQKRVAELATANLSLQQRDSLLSVVAQITKDLLKTEDIDVAIPTALETVGKLVNMSRAVLILEHQDPSTQRLKHCVIYEWVAAGIADHDSVGMSIMDNDNFQVMIQPLYQGQSMWRVIDELPVITRQQFDKLQIKSTGVVPIFIEGSYIGCVGFDDCVTPRQWNQQEIDVLTAAAESIGAALHRKQLVECLITERARIAEKRVAELAKANESLRGCVNRLADQPDCETFWEHILLEASAQINSYAAALFLYDQSSNTRVMKRYVREGKVLPIKTTPELSQFKKAIPGDIASFWEKALFQGEPVLFNLDNWDERVSPRMKWHQNQGHRSILRVPLILGDRPLGFIGFCFREARTSLPENMELIMALAQQATLAIQLTNLAEQGRQAAILEERNRMAREIHDTLAQAFTGVIIQLGAASRIITDESADVQAHINQARDLAREGLAEARRSVNALRPQILETSNLRKAFNRLAAQMSAIDTQIICTVIGEVYRLSIDRENNLLRIGQEALTNAVKYAQASEIQIELVYQPTEFILRVKDNGQGFEMDSLSMVQGFGLISMKERCDRISANLTIQSIPGQGTEIMILIDNDAKNLDSHLNC